MNAKVIPIKGNRQEAFIKIIAAQFNIIAPLELKLIGILIKYDLFSPFHMDKYTREKLRKEMECTENTLATCLARLHKANVLIRKGKTRWFNASFRGLDKIDCIVFRE